MWHGGVWAVGQQGTPHNLHNFSSSGEFVLKSPPITVLQTPRPCSVPAYPCRPGGGSGATGLAAVECALLKHLKLRAWLLPEEPLTNLEGSKAARLLCQGCSLILTPNQELSPIQADPALASFSPQISNSAVPQHRRAA